MQATELVFSKIKFLDERLERKLYREEVFEDMKTMVESFGILLRNRQVLVKIKFTKILARK